MILKRPAGKECVYLAQGELSTCWTRRRGGVLSQHTAAAGFPWSGFKTSRLQRALPMSSDARRIQTLSHRQLTGPEVAASLPGYSRRRIEHFLRCRDDEFVAAVGRHRKLTGPEVAWKPCCSRRRFNDSWRGDCEFVAAVDGVVAFRELQ